MSVMSQQVRVRRLSDEEGRRPSGRRHDGPTAHSEDPRSQFVTQDLGFAIDEQVNCTDPAATIAVSWTGPIATARTLLAH